MARPEALAVQDRYAPENRCFGCGPANEKGLRIKSYPAPGGAAGELVCEWQPEEHHQAFGNVLNGGIIGALLDCHSNWTAAVHLMTRDALEGPPCTVTLDFHVRLKRPTPTDQPVRLRAWPASAENDRVVVEATLTSGEKVTATCTGTFVAVKPGHPAYHRW
ncbi:MAG TPA: PaaI family thioesterase [Thermoanaerobaculia bacterium]|jgi:acyl-coenzyme A thioesterase PaaI-like protein